jgi:WD40 repeat protein
LRHTENGALIWEKNQTFGITDAIFTNDGQRIITAHSTSSLNPELWIKVWDINTGEYINDDLLKNYENKNLYYISPSIALTNNNILFVLAVQNYIMGGNHKILEIDINYGNVIKEHNASDEAYKIIISPNNQYLASIANVDDKFLVYVHRIPTYEFLYEFSYGDNLINDIAFSADGRLIGAAGIGSCKIWDVETKKLVSIIVDENITSFMKIKFSQDSKKVLFGTAGFGIENAKTQIWDIESSNRLYRYNYPAGSAIDITLDSKYILVGYGNLILYYSRWEPTFIKNNNVKNENIIYPNPVTGVVTIKYEVKIPDKYTVNLTDINGIQIEKIYEGFYEPGIKLISYNTSKLPVSVYFINISNSKTIDSYKIVKEK